MDFTSPCCDDFGPLSFCDHFHMLRKRHCLRRTARSLLVWQYCSKRLLFLLFYHFWLQFCGLLCSQLISLLLSLYLPIGMRRLNTCTRCILRTCSTLRSICRAKIESRHEQHAKGFPLSNACNYLDSGHRGFSHLPRTQPRLRFELQPNRLYRYIAFCDIITFPRLGFYSPIPAKIFIPRLADPTRED